MKLRKKSLSLIVLVISVQLGILGCVLSGSWQRDAASQASVSEIAEFNQDRTKTAQAVVVDYPTQGAQPTYTFYPTYTEFPATEESPEVVEETATATATAVVAENLNATDGALEAVIEISGDEFYCDDDPNSVTFRLDVNDIDVGFALYYHLKDVASGAESEDVIEDIHRDKSETFRYLELLGDPAIVEGYYTAVVADAPGSGPAYLVYEIISDDGSFRSGQKSDITYYPCGYTP